jgi:hypothetical protein
MSRDIVNLRPALPRRQGCLFPILSGGVLAQIVGTWSRSNLAISARAWLAVNKFLETYCLADMTGIWPSDSAAIPGACYAV